MLRCIVILFHRCMKAVTGSSEGGRAGGGAGGAGGGGGGGGGAGAEKTATWNIIKVQCAKAINTVTDMKFKDPRAPDAEMTAFFTDVAEQINAAFDELAEQM